MAALPLDQKNLGRLIRRFHFRPMGFRDAGTVLLPGTLAVLVPLYYGYARAHYAKVYYGPVAMDQWSRPWYALALIALLIFLILGVLRIIASRQSVSVYERGLRLSFGPQKNLRWEEIAGLATETSHYHFFGISLKNSFQGMIYPNIHKPIRLTNNIQDLPELLTLIKARLYPRLLPNLVANLEKGQSLHFGPLAMRKDGLILSNKKTSNVGQTVPWVRLQSVDVVSGYLVVELSDHTRRKLPISKIPNIELLLQLIQQGVNA